MAEGNLHIEIDDRVFPVWRFGSILRHWAKQAQEQLKDSYHREKMWTGSRADEVWSARVVHVQKKDKDGKVIKEWDRHQTGWYDESKYREKKDKGSGKYWYSTGESYKSLAVKVVNQSLREGQVDFRTTTGALFAEAGIGLNGPHFTRGRRSRKGRTRIKVDRTKNYGHKKRYVDSWVPGRGFAHRPNTRQQVNLLARRLKWVCRKVYMYNLSAYIGYSIAEAARSLENVRVLAPSRPKYKVVYKPTKKQQAASLAAWDKAYGKK